MKKIIVYYLSKGDNTHKKRAHIMGSKIKKSQKYLKYYRSSKLPEAFG